MGGALSRRCGIFGLIGSLQTDIDALDSSWSSAAVDATKCTAMASNTALGQAFDLDLSGWKRFAQDPGAFGVDTVLATWQSKLSEWQTKIKAAGCTVSGTTVTPPAASSATSLASLAVLALGIGAVLYLFGPAIRKSLG